MIDLINISLQFGGRYLFRDINYKINSGQKISLVGANGSGKSSLLKVIWGEIETENGFIQKEKNISIGYLPQETVTHIGKSLIEEASSALTNIISLQEKEQQITLQLNQENISSKDKEDLVNQLGEVHHRLEELDSYASTSKVEKILIGLGFEKEDFTKQTETFSGGWQMRIALSKILISQNDILLLDEPTNHLDIDSQEWLINFLKAYKGSLIIVSHDKNFINQVTAETLEIFNGKFYSYKGNYESYLKFKTERDELAIHQYELQQKKIKETERFIERFRYKATKARQVQSRIKQLEKLELIDLPENQDNINIRFPEPPQSGRIPVELIGISKAYGTKKVLENLNLTIARGDKIAFVGPNGAGKTTLAKVIANILKIDSGKRILGHNTQISYYAQDVADDLNPQLDIIDTVQDSAQEKTIGQLRSLLGSFLFTGDDVFKKISVLSGGEKSRVALCKILLEKANLVVLDEPTNHLDYSSKLLLQKALVEFPGSLIIVSHDIDFLKPIVNKVIDIRKGIVKVFNGGIDYYFFKREQLIVEDNPSEKVKPHTQNISKKDQKRIEAEHRQKKHNLTKDLISEITNIEKRIANLEESEKYLEQQLTKPEVYSIPEKAKETSQKLSEVKKELEESFGKWENKNNKLNEILQQFN